MSASSSAGSRWTYLVGRTRREDDDRADAVAAELGDLPLALAQAATVIELQDLSYGDYLARLRSRPLERILPADPGDAYPHGVAAAILMAIDAVETAGEPGLTTPVLNALALLSADGVSRDVLADIAAIDRFNETVGRLVRSSLLVWADGSREVVMHRLVGRAVRDRLEHAGELQSVLTAAANGLRPRMVPEDEA
jgi:hypothetical protein